MLRAFGPIAAGHAASVSVVVVLVGAAQLWIDATILRWIGGGLLIAFGMYKWLVPLSHPRWVGMRVGPADLALWSFLMASAHGAGLMLMPVLLRLQPDAADHVAHDGGRRLQIAGREHQAAGTRGSGSRSPCTRSSMLLVMAAIALVVYQKVGLKILRSAWINLDRVWAITLIVAPGAVTFVL